MLCKKWMKLCLVKHILVAGFLFYALFEGTCPLLPIMHRTAVQINSFSAVLFRYAGVLVLTAMFLCFGFPMCNM